MTTTPLEPLLTAPAAEPVKKKSRPNPARRRTAKAKLESETQSTQPLTPSTGASIPAKTINEANEQRSQNFSNSIPLKKKPSLPVLSRQKTDPVPSRLVRQKTEPLSTTKRPILPRTVTAPNSNIPRSSALALSAPALVTGGLVGCAAGAAILLGVGMWYDFAGAESAVLAARSAKLCVDNLADEIMTSLKAGTYNADEALDMLRRTTLAYASTIPEGAPFVERVFREIDTVRKQRGREIDKVVAETYAELQQAGREGAGSAEMRTIIVRQLTKLSSFAGRATQDIVIRNPKLRPYRNEMVKAVQGPTETKEPTVRVNMAVRQKQAAGG